MNVLTLTGRLTADPVRRDTPKGVVCEFRLAVDGRPRLWITVQTWGQLAGRCAQHLARRPPRRRHRQPAAASSTSPAPASGPRAGSPAPPTSRSSTDPNTPTPTAPPTSRLARAR